MTQSRLSCMLSAAVAIIGLNLALSATLTGAADSPVGWCAWLPWTCETSRTSLSDKVEQVQCLMRRQRYCCNSEPPKQANSCPGGAADSRRSRNNGPEDWVSRSKNGQMYRGMQCPPSYVFNNQMVPIIAKVNACSTAYPIPQAGSGYTKVWCPFEYWSAWSYASGVAPLCQLARTRTRRCGCSARSYWASASDVCASTASPGTERQVMTGSCSDPTAGGSGGGSGSRNDSWLIGATMTTAEPDQRSPVPIVVGCLAVLAAVAAIVAIVIICCIVCKRKQRQPSFAARVASSFRRAGVVGVIAEPSAPAYGSAAYYDAGSPVPTVSLKVSTTGSLGETPAHQLQPPPPYTSQPEIRTSDAGAGASGSQPPPYNWRPTSWESPPVEP